MKHHFLFRFFSKYKSVALFMLFSSLLFSFCTQEPNLWRVNSTEQVASDYINSKPEFSEFAKLVDMTGLRPLLGIRGPYTVMLPTNDAMFAYYKEKGKNSLTDFDLTFLQSLVRNHLIKN